MPFRTWVAGETPTAAMFNDYLQKQVVVVCTSGTRPGTPVEGMVIYETDTDKVLTYTGTVWELPKNVAGGTLGYAQAVATQGSITSVVDLTGLSVTVTVGTSRRIRVSARAKVSNNTATGRTFVAIKEGATLLVDAIDHYHAAANSSHAGYGAVVLTPTTGTHTYKLTGQALSGTASLDASATNPAYILAEDIGGV